MARRDRHRTAVPRPALERNPERPSAYLREVGRKDECCLKPLEGVHHFGEYSLDVADRRLAKDGISVKIQDKPLTALIVLVSNAGRLVSRGALAEALWGPETFVDAESGLNTAIRKLRQALGDSAARPRYIETVPGRGYRMLAVPRGEPKRDAQPLAAPKADRWTMATRLRVAASLLIVLSMALSGSPASEPGSGGSGGSIGSASWPGGNKTGDRGASLKCDDEITVRVAVVDFQGEGVAGGDLGELVAAVHDDVVGALWAVDRLRLAARPFADLESVSPADSDVVLAGRLRREGEEILLTIRLLEPEGLGPLWQRTFAVPRHEPFLLRAKVAETVASFLEGALSA